MHKRTETAHTDTLKITIDNSIERDTAQFASPVWRHLRRQSQLEQM